MIAPTGTIGLIMDCDTTGVEPDFALVKFKKLSGGGYFKIINQSVPAALKNLHYTDKQIETIVKYAVGSATFAGAPGINHQSLSEKGFIAEEIKKLDTAVGAAFEIGFVFNVYALGEECLQRLGFKPAQYYNVDWNLLRALGFSEDEMRALASEYLKRSQRMSVIEFKEISGLARKQAILFLEHFDRQGLTRREGDARVLR